MSHSGCRCGGQSRSPGAAGRDLPAGAAAGGPRVSQRESPRELARGQKPPPPEASSPLRKGMRQAGLTQPQCPRVGDCGWETLR